jgi:dTDP-4-dehydrorhamnose reductase
MSDHRWLITGGSGQLAREVTKQLDNLGENFQSFSSDEMDICNVNQTLKLFSRFRPTIVVNCAAWTNVDNAERHEAEAFSVNAQGARNVALACRNTDAKLIHISTDYVFSGADRTPYSENQQTDPTTTYGRSKLLGEQNVREILPDASWILRTAWLYSSHGKNFVKTILRKEREVEFLRVVDDQLGQPTWAKDVAFRIVEVALQSPIPGIYHVTNSGETSWFQFSKKIFELIGKDPQRIIPIKSSENPQNTRRPSYSVLGNEGWALTNLRPLRDWQEALAEAIKSIIPD